MGTTASGERDYGFFTAGLDNEVLHIRFKKDLLGHLTDLSKRDVISKFLDHVLASGSVRVILINSDFREAGCEEYTRFFLKRGRLRNHYDFHRLCNMTGQLILAILGMERLVIHVSQGHVISTFLNISLACDYRIAADTTIFCNPYLDLGLIPIGGGPFFLSKLMGRGKALETLLLNKEISAPRAEQLGLVDRVVPAARIDAYAVEIAGKFSKLPASTVTGMKRLMNFSKKELEAYFELEQQEMIRILNSESFLSQLAG